ncbi:MAG: hypothetical protein M1827_007490 [Pycnora praestabilis]|nr:MAG: hypothetical protein M1827_007490 [Pycnora praestabilis]
MSLQEVKNIAVIGAGVTGLQCALFLQEAGYKVTIAAKHLPGDHDAEYASPWAGADWRTHASSEDEEGQWDVETYKFWMRMKMADAESFVRAGLGTYTLLYYWDKPTAEIAQGTSSLWWRSLVHSFKPIPASSLPPGVHYGVSFTTVTVNVPTYLSYLLSTFTSRGGSLIRLALPVNESFSSNLKRAADAAATAGKGKVDVFVNATGLGAREVGLGSDETIFPTRGQTVLVKGEADMVRTRLGHDSVAYVIPRRGGGGTILGGCKQVGSWNKEVDPEMAAQILQRCKALAPELLNSDGEFEILSHQVGFRPSREGGTRVETEVLEEDGVRVVHCYGHSGAGYQKSVGSARKVVRLIDEMCGKESSSQVSKL